MTVPWRPPYLTVVLTGRNDDFGGDFNERLLAAAEFNHRHLLGHGIPHEYLFVEWSPIPGRPYLAEILKAQLPWWDRLYVVDPAWHTHFCVNPKLVFMEFFAKNVGLRRASGRFVLTTNTDIWLSRGVLQALSHGPLDAGTVYRCVRVDLARAIGYQGTTFEVLEHPDSFLRSNMVLPELYSNGAGDFILLDRDSYLDIGGFNEVYRTSKIHKDANFCHKAHALGYSMRLIGEVYHFDHDSSWMNVMHLYDNHHADAPFGRSNWDWTMHYDNPASWGLRDAPEQVRADGIVFIGYP